jgi:hypothetical protein
VEELNCSKYRLNVCMLLQNQDSRRIRDERPRPGCLSLSSRIAISSNTHNLPPLHCRGSTGSPLEVERFTAIVSSCQRGLSSEQFREIYKVEIPADAVCLTGGTPWFQFNCRYLFSQADLDPTHLLLLQASRPKSLTNHVPACMGCTKSTLLK